MLQVEMTTKSLNSGDVFILDAGLVLYQWQGKSSGTIILMTIKLKLLLLISSSGPSERLKAAQLTRAISDERGGKASIIVLGMFPVVVYSFNLQRNLT